MAQGVVDSTRLDPYTNFKFRVKWDGRYVAGVSKVSALEGTTDVVDFREGGDPSTSQKSTGRTKYDAITLERGVTFDAGFVQWASQVHNDASGQGTESPPVDFFKDIVLEMYTEGGDLEVAYHIYRCWVSHYQALPDPDARANAVAIERITIEYEGWVRELPVTKS